MDDEIGAEELIRYGLFPELAHDVGPTPPPLRGGGSVDSYDQFDGGYIAPPKTIQRQEESSAFNRPARIRKSDFSFSRPSPSPLRGGDGDVVLKRVRREDPDVQELFQGLKQTPGGPMNLSGMDKGKTVVPYRIRAAADALLVACENKEIRLDYTARNELGQIVACDDEYTMIDPPVVIWDTLYTGTCNIYLKEVVRFSVYLMACFFNLMYQVEAVPEALSDPKSYKQAKVKPYHDSNVEHAQTLACEQTVMAYLRSTYGEEGMEEKLKLIKIHLVRVGHISSFQATDPEFIQYHLENMGSVMSNEKRNMVVERPLMGQGSEK